jgi:hypothetical protein
MLFQQRVQLQVQVVEEQHHTTRVKLLGHGREALQEQATQHM